MANFSGALLMEIFKLLWRTGFAAMMFLKPKEISPTRRYKVYDDITVGSEPRYSFYMMVVLSTIIAAFGLLSNSTAVVIGAMLVAPLMTPILGMTLALTSGNYNLLGRATFAEIFGILLSVGVGFMVGGLTPEMGLSLEIMARTTPTIFDIIVAIAAGLAGAYSMVDERLNAAMPGVAIATSLVPPLTASGLCLSQGRLDLATSAFLLFFANFLSIQIAGGFIFGLFGISAAPFRREANGALPDKFTLPFFLRRFALSLLLLAGVALFMTQTLRAMVGERRFHRQLETTLTEELKNRTGAQMTELRYSRENNKIDVVVVVFTPQEFLPKDVNNIEEKLKKTCDPGIRLIVRSVLSKDVDSRGPVFITDKERSLRQQETGKAQLLSNVSRLVSEQLSRVPGASLVNVRRSDNDKTIIAIVRTPTAIKPEQIKAIQGVLHADIDPELRLIVSSVLTRDADAEHYIYEMTPKDKGAVAQAPLTGDALAFHKRLKDALQIEIGKVMSGASLLEFHNAESKGFLHVLATVSTPYNFKPKQVRSVQKALQDDIDPRIRLVVRSMVGADVDQDNYLPLVDEALFVPTQEEKP